ncbi:gag-Pol polyprotein [Trichonephila clavipes]|nr:gag-Pol polyprotein [Trichonephila clavipes]
MAKPKTLGGLQHLKTLEVACTLEKSAPPWYRGRGLKSRNHSPDNTHSVAFSQPSSSPRLIEDETFNDNDIINNLIDHKDGQEEPNSLIVVFSSIVRDFLELFYNLWRTVLAKNKIVLDSALRLQSFRTPKTQQLVSEVGLNANNKSDGGPVPDSSRKLTASMNANMGEMKSELTGMNANMGEMKSDLTASMNANMTEMKSELTASMNANMGELNTKLTNVNEQISANKEELKSDLKGIGDKLTTMDKKFEEMEGRIESVEYKFENKFVDIENKFENKFEDMESKLEAKIFEKVEDVSISFRSDLEKLKQKVMTGQGDEFKFQAPYSKPSIKLSTYDGKSSWQVYKTQFSIVADANQWDSQTKACQLAASLRADAADILQTLPETQRLDFDVLVNALELRFGEKCVKDYSRLQLKSRQQKVSETLQELATDVERLSHLAFSDCPTEVREVLALQHFIDGVRDPEIQKALRMADLKDLKGALVFAMKFEAAQQATRKDRHPIRAVNESNTSNSSVERLERQMRSFMNRVESLMSQKADGKKTLKCWTCGREGHLQRSCRARQGAETNKRLPEGGVGKTN